MIEPKSRWKTKVDYLEDVGQPEVVVKGYNSTAVNHVEFRWIAETIPQKAWSLPFITRLPEPKFLEMFERVV